jgi:hypothetical protein
VDSQPEHRWRDRLDLSWWRADLLDRRRDRHGRGRPRCWPSEHDAVERAVDGISGCSGGDDHAEAFQPYGASGANINIDHFTATTNCQAFELEPAYSSPMPAYDLRAVNLSTLRNPYRYRGGTGNLQLYYLTGAFTDCVNKVTHLDLGLPVYLNEPDRTLAINSVWPDTDEPTGCKGGVERVGEHLHVPEHKRRHLTVFGTLDEGLPPGGDYVPVGAAGTG